MLSPVSVVCVSVNRIAPKVLNKSIKVYEMVGHNSGINQLDFE